MKAGLFILMGYLSGSILYARVFAAIFGKKGIIENSKDKNPGTANAFMYGGFACGSMTLIFDLLKGFLPVFFYLHDADIRMLNSVWTALVLAAPVLGHAFPVFYKMHGGKGIAVTFGCLLGLVPVWKPVGILILFFVFFSCVVRINPHFYRTLVVYACSMVSMAFCVEQKMIFGGFVMITAIVCSRMLISTEEKERVKVRLLWMR